MKLVYLHQYFTTPKHNGGQRSYQFARRLAAKGHDVHLVTTTAFHPVAKENGEFFISKRTVDGINVHFFHIGYSNNMSYVRRSLAFIYFMLAASLYIVLMRRVDLVYATSTPISIGVPALAANLFRRIPFVFEVRDLWPDVPVAMGIIKNRMLIRALDSFEKLLYRRASKIVCLSPGMQAAIVKKGIATKKVVVIPNGCDMGDFAEIQSKASSISSLRTNTHTKLCLYAGTFGDVNNLEFIIHLAREVLERGGDLVFILVGQGKNKPQLEELLRRFDLHQTVHILPPVSKKELIEYFNAVDCCFSTVRNIPALFNNSANKFFDSIAAGCPIVINHGGWLAEMIDKHQLGLVLGADMSTNAIRLTQYLSEIDPTITKKSISQFAKSHFDRELLFERLYDEVFKPREHSARPS